MKTKYKPKWSNRNQSVSWCFEPSHLHRVISGPSQTETDLETAFSFFLFFLFLLVVVELQASDVGLPH